MFQHVTNVKIISEILCFYISLLNLVHILYLQHISAGTS